MTCAANYFLAWAQFVGGAVLTARRRRAILLLLETRTGVKMAKKATTKKTTGKTGYVSVGDIGKMAGVPSNTVHHWIDRDSSFPKPVDDPTSGKLYNKSAVVKWLKKTGRA